MQRNIVVLSSCPRCLIQEEDSAHIIRSCQYAVSVWELANLPTSTHLDFTPWIRANLQSTLEFRGFIWGDIFSYLCREVWNTRNECVFSKNTSSSSLSLITKACVLTKEFHCALGKSLTNTSPIHASRGPRLISSNVPNYSCGCLLR